MQIAPRWLVLGALLGAVAAPACGPSGPPESAPDDDAGEASGGTQTSSGGSSSGGNESGSGGSSVVSDPKAATRVARLTHAQYQNTVSDLFGITDDVSSGFATDAQNGFRFDSSINYVVDSRLGAQYRSAAESLALRVAADDSVFTKVVPCDSTTEACRDEFISSFGLRAFRRPLRPDEQQRFAALFDEAASIIESGDAFNDGVSLVVEAMLESPDFLYRGELGSELTGSGRIALSSYEIASRISYFLYNSMPDEELLRAAESDELTDPAEVEKQVRRLLDAPRTIQHLVHFHEQAFDFARYSRISLDADAFPEVPDDLSARALTASRMFIEDVIASEGGLLEFLTAPFAYADSELGRIYGVDTPSDFERIELDPNERPGLLTQVGFLASHAYSRKTDPIHRGLFVVRDLLCTSIPDPPAGASMTPPPEGAPTPKTTREEVDILTSQDDCSNCHEVINPAGFAFENFDAAGQIRTVEGDTEVTTDGVLLIGDREVPFSNAPEMISAVADAPEAHACYLGKWADFAHGRELKKGERDWLSEVPSHLSVNEIIVRVVGHESFITRPADQESP